MRLFLDASVLLAAAGSSRGASRHLFAEQHARGWMLLSSRYALREVARNIGKLPAGADVEWIKLIPVLLVVDDIVSLDRPVIFPAAKDRPILFTALACADVLLTLDRGDFAALLGGSFYGLRVLTPALFLEQERAAGRL